MAEPKTSNSGKAAKAAQDAQPTDAEQALAQAKANAEKIVSDAKAEAAAIREETEAWAKQKHEAAKAEADQIRSQAAADAERIKADVAAAGGFEPATLTAVREAAPNSAPEPITVEEAAAVFSIPAAFVHAHHLRADGKTVVVTTTNGQKLVGTL